jgi:Na+/H+ antiporter NhaD/arsenite permease-like protein
MSSRDAELKSTRQEIPIPAAAPTEAPPEMPSESSANAPSKTSSEAPAEPATEEDAPRTRRTIASQVQDKGVARTILGVVLNHLFLVILIVVSVITSFFNTPQWSYVDWHVIIVLFQLMLVIKAFEQYGLISWLSMHILARCTNARALTVAMCLLSLFLSMVATNDVTILTVVPLVLMIGRKSNASIFFPVTMVTICANLGSSLTPIGNPHNLYIFTHFNLSVATFMSYSLPLFVVSLILLFSSVSFVKKTPVTSDTGIPQIVNPKRIIPFLFAAVSVILCVLQIAPDWATLIVTIGITLLADPRMLLKADYNLLFTIFFIFIAVGNISHMAVLHAFLTALVGSQMSTYFSGLLLSQFISNVPITVLLSQFTLSPAALFYGVDIGGLGSPIASLANLITITLFLKEFPQDRKKFLTVFLGVNFAGLIILGTIFGLLQFFGVLQ